MKKLILFLVLLTGYHYVHSQWSVNLFKVRDYLPEFNSINDQITVLEMDNQRNIWFNLYNGWGGGGMVKFTGKEWISFNNEVFGKMDLSPMVNAIAFDLENTVWVGTDDGLARFDGINPTGWEIYRTENYQGPDNKITAIVVDHQNFKYIGFNTGYLVVFDGSKWIPFDKYSGKGKINDLKKDLEGNIWIARNGTPGLVKFKDFIFTEFNDLSDIRSIGINPSGPEIYVTSKDQLFIIMNDEIIEKVPPEPLMDYELYDIAVFGKLGIFISSDKGLFWKNGPAFELISSTNSTLPDLVPPVNFNPVPLLYDDAMENKLWFSFIYKGVLADYSSIGYLINTPMVPPEPVSLNQPAKQFCYGDSIILDANVNAANYIWDGINTVKRTITLYDTKTILLTAVFQEQCMTRDTFQIDVGGKLIDSIVCVESGRAYYNTSTSVLAQHVFEDEEIGVVTCDPELNRNLVVWKKTPDKGTEFYNVYKMISLDDSIYLGNVNYNELTVFTDMTSDPKAQSVRYVITTVDTCGNESYLSSVHKTMHLATTPGNGNEVTLIWEHYEGIPVEYYYIYRGTDSTAMELIDSVDYYSGKTQYTDVNAPAYKVYYQIAIKLPEPIVLTTGKKAGSGPYSQSMSNLEDNRFLTSVTETKPGDVLLYPNPFDTWTQIDFENPVKYPYQLVITDMSGKTVKVMKDICDDNIIVLRENLPEGFYLFELKGDKVYRGKFVIE